ncbi:MAG: carboxypeptidase-like regulatory domain-containing protein, partial [Thermoanaerobaculia bacterium]
MSFRSILFFAIAVAFFTATLLHAATPVSFEGRVVNASGAPVPDARVAVTPVDGTQAAESATATDAKGVFTLPLPQGDYIVQIAMKQFTDLAERVT